MFDVETTRFLTDLAANNTREWFQDNRARYDAHVARPARAFADVMDAELTRLCGAPMSSKIFRIHRDVRFAKDKTPYNTHIRMTWHTDGAPLAWMVGLDVDRLTVGYGCLAFDRPQLDHWRAVIDGDAGGQLAGVLATLTEAGLRLGDPELKRVPAPFAADHPQAALLRHKSLAVWNDALPVSAAYGDQAAGVMVQDLAAFEPLRDWVHANL